MEIKLFGKVVGCRRLLIDKQKTRRDARLRVRKSIVLHGVTTTHPKLYSPLLLWVWTYAA